MPDLTETTLAASVTSAQTQIPLASVSGINVGDVLFFDGEAVCIQSFVAAGNPAIVTRGYGGTTASSHLAGSLVIAGRPHHFKTHDPKGIPLDFPYTNPWVNIRDNRVWRAQGDQVGPGVLMRYWTPITLTQAIGALGVRVPPVSTP